MTSLLTKLQSAKEGSRELDAEIARHFGWTLYDSGGGWDMNRWRDPSGVTGAGVPPSFTTSLDCIVSLIERVKPGACWRVEKLPPALAAAHGASHWASCGMPGEQEDACADGGALALCISLLRAMVE